MTPRERYRLPLPGRAALVLGERTLVMGIVNVTPDSFADGGVRLDPARAIDDALRMVEEGADILDIGGESTRPGAEPVDAAEEMRRVLPVVEGLARQTGALLSVDTYKAGVAREAIARGVAVVNDISALTYDESLATVVAESGAAVVLMHNRGRSRDMYREAVYDDVAGEIARELESAIDRAVQAGISRDSVVLDPGLGFAKTAEHSYQAMAGLHRLAEIGRPILSGPSRKSFLKQPGDRGVPAERDWATAAACTASVLAGAHIVRVHAVREMAQVVRAADAVRAAAGR